MRVGGTDACFRTLNRRFTQAVSDDMPRRRPLRQSKPDQRLEQRCEFGS